MVGKAEWTRGEANPRFVVTSLHEAEATARYLYEDLYCARGDMENRIKECQLDLFADRTPATTMRANQLRLWFASMAYVLLCALRRIGLAGTAAGRGDLRHHPPQAPEDRRASDHQRAPRQVRVCLGLPVQRHLRCRLHPAPNRGGLRPPNPLIDTSRSICSPQNATPKNGVHITKFLRRAQPPYQPRVA